MCIFSVCIYLSIYIYIYPFLDSSTSPQVEPLDRSLRLMAQTTCCHVRKCPLEEKLTKIICWGVADPLNRQILPPSRGRPFRIRHSILPATPPSGEIDITSFPVHKNR